MHRWIVRVHYANIRIVVVVLFVGFFLIGVRWFLCGCQLRDVMWSSFDSHLFRIFIDLVFLYTIFFVCLFVCSSAFVSHNSFESSIRLEFIRIFLLLTFGAHSNLLLFDFPLTDAQENSREKTTRTDFKFRNFLFRLPVWFHALEGNVLFFFSFFCLVSSLLFL
jgi:hypothetical protein